MRQPERLGLASQMSLLVAKIEPLRPPNENIVATGTNHRLIGQLSVDQACNDVQWLL
jgi:hypothetical protein